MKFRDIIAFATLFLTAVAVNAQNNVAEEVAWVVGDQPIWKSEIEDYYNNLIYEQTPIKGDPYCVVPEMIAVEKLYLHQADIDTVEVSDAMVMAEVDARINLFVNRFGSKEKVEEYFRRPMPDIKQQMIENTRNGYRVREVQRSLTKDAKVTPSDVRK